MGYLEGAAQLKKTKRYRCSVTQGRAGGRSLFPLAHTHKYTLEAEGMPLWAPRSFLSVN